MTKFMDRLDLQIRLHLAIKHLLAVLIHNYGKIAISQKLEKWYTLSWEEFFEEIKSAGIFIKDESDKICLKEIFDDHKKQVLSIEDEINRLDQIVINNKIKI
jgi:hypothetical protein